jgi:hypothetical protein
VHSSTGLWSINESKKYLDHPDPMHRAFLKAGAARVVLPVRPGFEDTFLAFVNTGDMPSLNPNLS